MTKFTGLTALLIAGTVLLGAWALEEDRSGLGSLRLEIDDVCCAAPPLLCCAVPDRVPSPPVELPSFDRTESEQPLAAVEAERPRAIDG